MGRVQHAPSGCKNSSVCDRGSHSGLIWQVQLACVIIPCSCHCRQETPRWEPGRTKTEKVGGKFSGTEVLTVLLSICKWSPRPFSQGFSLEYQAKRGKRLFFPLLFWLTVHDWNQNRRHCLLLSRCSSKRHAVKRGRLAKVALLCAVRGAVLESMTNSDCSPAEHKYSRMRHSAGRILAVHTTLESFSDVLCVSWVRRDRRLRRSEYSHVRVINHSCWFWVNPCYVYVKSNRLKIAMSHFYTSKLRNNSEHTTCVCA